MGILLPTRRDGRERVGRASGWRLGASLSEPAGGRSSAQRERGGGGRLAGPGRGRAGRTRSGPEAGKERGRGRLGRNEREGEFRPGLFFFLFSFCSNIFQNNFQIVSNLFFERDWNLNFEIHFLYNKHYAIGMNATFHIY